MKKINFFSFLAMIALTMSMVFTSCKKDDTPVDTRTDPGTIAKDSLVAYFPFDADGVDKVATLTPATATGVTYVDGQRGKSYQGAENAYLLYTLPAASKLATMTQGFTVSAWVKATKVYGDPVPIIFQIGKSDDHFWGNLTWMQERAGDATTGAAKDSCFYKFVFQAGGGSNWYAPNPAMYKKFMANQWQYITLTYNASTSMFNVYVNGILYSERSGKAMQNSTAAGALTFSKADKLIIGGWLTKILDGATDAWMGWYKGNLDEMRVYNYGLSATRVKNLYDAEVSYLD